jgi:hypothetical protein
MDLSHRQWQRCDDLDWQMWVSWNGDPNIAPTGHLLLWETNGLGLSHVVHGHFGKVLDASMYGTRSPQNRVFQRVSQLNSFCCCFFSAWTKEPAPWHMVMACYGKLQG